MRSHEIDFVAVAAVQPANKSQYRASSCVAASEKTGRCADHDLDLPAARSTGTTRTVPMARSADPGLWWRFHSRSRPGNRRPDQGEGGSDVQRRPRKGLCRATETTPTFHH